MIADVRKRYQEHIICDSKPKTIILSILFVLLPGIDSCNAQEHFPRSAAAYVGKVFAAPMAAFTTCSCQLWIRFPQKVLPCCHCCCALSLQP